MNINLQNKSKPYSPFKPELSSQRQPKRYQQKQLPRSINEELLQLVARVQALENQLVDEQRLKEFLLEQNGSNRQYLQKLKNNQSIRDVKIRQLRQEAEANRINHRNVDECEKSLKALYKEIEELQQSVINKEGECQLAKEEVLQIQDKKQQLKMQKEVLEKQRKKLEESIERYFKSYSNEFDRSASHIDNLEVRSTNLLIGLQSVKLEEQRIKRQHSQIMSKQRQLLIKLEYEDRLLRQRVTDFEKNRQIERICQHQSHLDSVVEQMLLKEDELVDELTRLNREYDEIYKKLRVTLQEREDEWSLERQDYERELRELKMAQKRLEYDLQQLSSQTVIKQQKRHNLSIEYELMHKLHLNLHSMQQLRQVEEKNNYLKLKINEAKEIKQLLTKEKQLLPTARFR